MDSKQPVHAHPQSRDTRKKTTAHPYSNQWINKLKFTQSTMAIVALIIASLALGWLIAREIDLASDEAKLLQLVDARVAAGVAKAEATAQTAKEHARVALDKVEQTQVQLGAKGLIQPSTH